MLQEWDESGSDRSDLLWRNVHEVNICRWHDWEVGILTTLDNFTDERTVVIQRSISLTDHVVFLILSGKVNDILVLQVYNTVLNLTVWSLDESEFIYLGIHTERRDKSNVRTLRTLDRTQTTIVCVVNVTNLESGTLS